MIGLLTALLSIVAALFALPAALLLVQVVAAIVAVGRKMPALAEAAPDYPPTATVLIPAHNEGDGLSGTLASVSAQLRAGDQVLVVADNCTDHTADVARRFGVRVIQRTDPDRRGKGYALDFGVRHIETWSSKPDVVIVVDADCTLGPNSVRLLAERAITSGRPVQSLDLMHAPEGAALKVRVAEFAWIVKDHVRPLGFHFLGLPCQLMGTGMAFPWAVVQCAPLATGHLAEDMMLGIALAEAGRPPLYCVGASVHSYFPVTDDALSEQRRRWEQGHLAVIAVEGLRLLPRALILRQWSLLAMSADICVPPLASLVLLQCGAFAVTSAFALAAGVWLPTLVASTGMITLLMAVFLAWYVFGRWAIKGKELLSIPGYVLGKVGIYADTLAGRVVGWERTKREARTDE